MHSFRFEDIRNAVSRSAFDKGSRYHQQRRVRVIKISDGEIEGTVQGTEPRPYRVAVVIDREPDRIDIEGSCSCPVGYNCKHVAALLLEVMDSPRGDDRPRTSNGFGLSLALGGWLAELDIARQTATDSYPAEIRQRLLYVLSLSSNGGEPGLRVRLLSVRLLKNGSYADRPSDYYLSNAFAAPAKFLRPVDRKLLRAIAHSTERTHYGAGRDHHPLAGEAGAELLERMIATGRCHWTSPDGPALLLGECRPAGGQWTILADGAQRFVFTVADGAAVLPVTPPWYLDQASGRCGPLETGLPPRIAGALLKAPAVPHAEVATLRSELQRRFPSHDALAPRALESGGTIRAAPAPCLRLMRRTLQHRYGYSYGWRQDDFAAAPATVMLARVAFDYAGHRLSTSDHRAAPVVMRDGLLLTIHRKLRAERKAFARLQEFGLKPVSSLGLYELPDDGKHDLGFVAGGAVAWTSFVHRGVPALRAEGWSIEIEPDFPIRVAEADDDWTAEIHEVSGVDWFELDLGVMIDGQRVDLLPTLLKLLKSGHEGKSSYGDTDGPEPGFLYAPLADGRLLPLPRERIVPLLRALHELFASGNVTDDGRLQFSPVRAAELAALEAATTEAARLRWLGGDKLREIGRLLRDFSGIRPAEIPAAFNGALRPYQQAGVNWLQFLREYGFGGILADDMGLGKTVQTLAHLAIEKESGRLDRPSLVIAPTSLMANWRFEAERFTPKLRVLTLHGADRKNRFAAIPDHDLVLTTYPLLPRDRETLLAYDYHIAILDEAQAIKNPQTTASQVAGLIRARHCLCLTGTPVENHLGELWSLCNVINPGLLGDRKHFARTFRAPIEKLGDLDRGELLRRRVRPFLLRRTKAQVEADLPPKTEIVENIEMEGAQSDLYETIRLAMHEKVRAEMARQGLARSHIVVLDALLKLRQVCCDPRLLKLDSRRADAGSAKRSRLMEMLPEMIEEGRRVLLFSQFTSMLALIEDELRAAKIPYVLLTGDTKDRVTPIHRFQSGQAPLFLISLKAGGTGLNLTAADTVIHYDPWWNPAVETQATDRAHRIGQDKPVFVYKLVTVGTVEEKMIELQARKRDLAEALFDPAAKTAAEITEADIDFLFAD